MLCSVCKKNEAKVHLIQIIGDKQVKVDLCDQCAKEKGVDDSGGVSFADLLHELGKSNKRSTD